MERSGFRSGGSKGGRIIFGIHRSKIRKKISVNGIYSEKGDH
jgi:hypothetical protein